MTVTGLAGLDLTRRFADVRFDGVSVPATAVLGAPGAAPGERRRAARRRGRAHPRGVDRRDASAGRDHRRVRQGAHRVRTADRVVPGAQAHPRRHQLLGRGEHRGAAAAAEAVADDATHGVGDRRASPRPTPATPAPSSPSSASRCTAASASPGSTTCTSTCAGSPPTACSTATPTGTASASAGSTGSERNGMTATTTDETISVDDFRAQGARLARGQLRAQDRRGDRRRRLAPRTARVHQGADRRRAAEAEAALRGRIRGDHLAEGVRRPGPHRVRTSWRSPRSRRRTCSPTSASPAAPRSACARR